MIEYLDSLLAQQPWWVIMTGTACLVFVLSRFGLVGISVNSPSSSNFDAKMRASTPSNGMIGQPSQKISLVTASTSLRNGATPSSSTKITFEGADAAEMQRLLLTGDKIQAIKLIRSKHNLELIDAKQIVEAMSKVLQKQ